MRKSMLLRKSYCLAPAHGVRTQKEAMSILQADASISDEFYKIGFISDSEVWLLILKKRNTSVHIYNEDEVDEMILLIRDSFIPTFTTLKDTLVKKLEEAESNWM